jgi:hypothetical protein
LNLASSASSGIASTIFSAAWSKRCARSCSSCLLPLLVVSAGPRDLLLHRWMHRAALDGVLGLHIKLPGLELEGFPVDLPGFLKHGIELGEEIGRFFKLVRVLRLQPGSSAAFWTSIARRSSATAAVFAL